jgi:hypothetical protein
MAPQISPHVVVNITELIESENSFSTWLAVAPYIEGRRPSESYKVRWAVADWWEAEEIYQQLNDAWGAEYATGQMTEQDWREGSANLHNARLLRTRLAERKIKDALEELEDAYEKSDIEMQSYPHLN